MHPWVALMCRISIVLSNGTTGKMFRNDKCNSNSNHHIRHAGEWQWQWHYRQLDCCLLLLFQ
jgi:hypothetical protein